MWPSARFTHIIMQCCNHTAVNAHQTTAARHKNFSLSSSSTRSTRNSEQLPSIVAWAYTLGRLLTPNECARDVLWIIRRACLLLKAASNF